SIVVAAAVVDIVEVAIVRSSDVPNVIIHQRPASLVRQVGVIGGIDDVDLVVPGSVDIGTDTPAILPPRGNELIGPVIELVGEIVMLGFLVNCVGCAQCEDGIIDGRAQALELPVTIDQPPLPGTVGAIDVNVLIGADGEDLVVAIPADAGGDGI